MITDAQLTAALERAAAAFDVPADGPARILEHAATPDADPSADRAVSVPRLAGRRRLVAGGALAAAAAVVIGVVVTVESTQNNPVRLNPIGIPRSASPPTDSVVHAGTAALPAPTRAFAASGSAGLTQAAPKTTITGGTAGGTPARIASSGTLHLAVARAALHRDVATLGSLASRLGGYVSSTNVTENTKASGGSLEIAVPASSFTSAIAEAERLGTTKSLVTRSDDVTKAYSDTTAEITALDDVRAQLESLLKRSGKVPDLLAVEQEIQSTQSQIDVLESERSSLDQEVTYATLVVDLAVPVAVVHKPTAPGVLDKAWSKAISGFTGGLKWLLGISGALLFALILVAAAGLGIFLFIRRGLPRLRRHFL